MAAISTVTYTLDIQKIGAPDILGKCVYAQIQFGDGSDTYPAGGILLDKEKLGGHYDILSVEVIEDNAAGYQYQFDVSTQKLRIFQVPALEIDTGVDIDAQPLDELADSETPAALTLQIKAVVR